MLSDAKLGRCESNATPLGLHPTPYVEDVLIGHSRSRHVCGRANRDIVGRDKFRNIYISVGNFISKIFVEPVTDRPLSTFYDSTLHVGIFAHL